MLGVIHNPCGLKFLLILGSIIIRSPKYGTPIMSPFRKQSINLVDCDVDRGNLHNIRKKTRSCLDFFFGDGTKVSLVHILTTNQH